MRGSDTAVVIDTSSPRPPSPVARPSAGAPIGSPSIHLDALRGLAAFGVLLAHWRDAFFVDYPAVPQHSAFMAAGYFVTGLGHQWVIVFFVMSGYLVGGSVVRSIRSDRWSWPDYLLTRLTRLYVVLLPALLIGGAIDWMGMRLAGAEAIYNGTSGMHIQAVDVHQTLNVPTFLANSAFLQTIALPGLHGWTVPLFGSNGPLWSLSNEFWYYMAFPFLAFMLSAGRSWRVRTLCGAALVLWGWFVGEAIALLGIAWLMGAIIVHLPKVPATSSWTRALAVASAGILLLGGLAFGKARDVLLHNLVLGGIVTYAMWITLHCATAPVPALYARAAKRASRTSYTLYLVHLPMLIFIKALLGMPRVVPNWRSFVVAAALLGIIVMYAQVLFELFETNTDRVRAYLKPFVIRRRAVTDGARPSGAASRSHPIR
jgi:peptidoglycan/LPS O-acetylase OafA/YrhL